MTLRANITTTYREVNASPPPATKKVQKEAADRGVHESERTRDPRKPAAKAPDQRTVPLAEHGGNRSAVRNKGQTSTTVDAFERSSLKDKSTAAQEARPGRPASVSCPDTSEREMVPKPVLAGHWPGSGESITKKTGEESPAGQKHSVAVADRNPSEQSRSIVKNVLSLELAKTDEIQEISSNGKPETQKSPTQPLPIAAPPKIHPAEPSAKAAPGNAMTNSSAVDSAPANVSAEKSDSSPSDLVSGLPSDSPNEEAMQRELTAALRFGQAHEDDPATSSDVAKHLQSEGVFGISANGRNLGTVDFIRLKQFEYTMDQKPFTTDDLLLEAEKAIHGTLNSDQSSAVSKSLIRAAESVNAYRNHSVKSSEHAEVAASARREET